MNKNDKFHGAEFEVSARAISDEELDSVSGGWSGTWCMLIGGGGDTDGMFVP